MYTRMRHRNRMKYRKHREKNMNRIFQEYVLISFRDNLQTIRLENDENGFIPAALDTVGHQQNWSKLISTRFLIIFSSNLTDSPCQSKEPRITCNQHATFSTAYGHYSNHTPSKTATCCFTHHYTQDALHSRKTALRCINMRPRITRTRNTPANALLSCTCLSRTSRTPYAHSRARCILTWVLGH